MRLDDRVTVLKGLTQKNKTALEAMGIRTVRDLLFHFPFRHDDFSNFTSLACLEPGTEVTVIASVAALSSRQARNRRMNITEAKLDDGEGKVTAIWFNQPYLTKYLKKGETYRFAGKVAQTKYGLRLSNPLYGSAEGQSRTVNPFMPVYPLSSGITQHVLRRLIRQVLPVVDSIEEHLPEDLLDGFGLMSVQDAIRSIHFPEIDRERIAAMRRLAFDELFRLQLAMGRTRKLRENKEAPAVPFDEKQVKSFVKSLPFELTGDQKRAAWETIRDMEKGSPMQRLLDGDVGSGKTAVAAVVAVNAASAGYQSAIMAPTEILAYQHYLTLSKMFGRKMKLALWTNSYKRYWSAGKDQECKGKEAVVKLSDRISRGDVPVVVGTHALVEKSLEFSKLAFVTIDEQHRFGVRTRRLLCEKGAKAGGEPHLLSMTATPIPRSLALTVYGDLDLSILKEKPLDRKPIKTKVVTSRGRAKAYAFIREQLEFGRQAFVVCPLIDKSDMLGVTSVTEEYERLKKEVFPDIEVGMLHGRMSASEKEGIMDSFKRGECAVLVATSVVEVGVDIPNATVMCVEGADRFGLAQLHQFRGRVGRGEHQSFCFLFPATYGATVKERLKAMESSDDGFSLAEKDLNMRGPGDLLGEEQSGHLPCLRLASVADMELIRDAREAAQAMLEVDPELSGGSALRDFVGRSVRSAHLE
jgi:ATP-dependent DNA helicase RecG